MNTKGYTLSYYVSGHGFGHATRVNQIITELLKERPATATTTTTTTSTGDLDSTAAEATMPSRQKHTIYIVSDAPQFIFQDVIALGAIYRNAKVDAGVVQPLAYSVDREKTIEGCKNFLSKREETIQLEVSWLAQVGVDCVLADAPFLPCAAASAYGIPAILITNFTFDEVYRFLREGDALDKDVLACADAALEDYKKASLLLRLPGSIDIPAFEDEILAMESGALTTLSTGSQTNGRSPSISDMDDTEEDVHQQSSGQLHTSAIDIEVHFADNKNMKEHGQEQEQEKEKEELSETSMGDTTPAGVMSPVIMRTAASSPNPSIVSGGFNSGPFLSSLLSPSTCLPSPSKLQAVPRRAVDVPLVVRMAVNSREDVLRSLGVGEELIRTHKVVLVSFGGQRLKQGWGNPLPEGWIGVICGLPVEHELPEGFYRSPHGVYVPDLTQAADIVIGKLGYGTCSECIAHDKPLIYVPRPQFIEEHGLINMMVNHGLPVEMTAGEFETGHWQRAILEADRQANEEREGRRLFMESSEEDNNASQLNKVIPELCVSPMTPMAPAVVPLSMVTEAEEQEPRMSGTRRRSRRSSSVASLSAFRPKGPKMARLSTAGVWGKYSSPVERGVSALPRMMEEGGSPRTPGSTVWFERRIPNNGGEVCARLVEEFMAQVEACEDV